jgi:hypothetical protein
MWVRLPGRTESFLFTAPAQGARGLYTSEYRGYSCWEMKLDRLNTYRAEVKNAVGVVPMLCHTINYEGANTVQTFSNFLLTPKQKECFFQGR